MVVSRAIVTVLATTGLLLPTRKDTRIERKVRLTARMCGCARSVIKIASGVAFATVGPPLIAPESTVPSRSRKPMLLDRPRIGGRNQRRSRKPTALSILTHRLGVVFPSKARNLRGLMRTATNKPMSQRKTLQPKLQVHQNPL